MYKWYNCNQTRGLYVTEEKTAPTVYANVYSDVIVHSEKKEVLKKGKDKGGMSYAMLHDKDRIYIGGYHLVQFDTVSDSFTVMDTVEDGENWSLYKFSDSIILSGRISGIYCYNIHSGNTTKLPYLSSNIPMPKSVYKIMWSKTKGVIAVAENGIYCIDNQLRVSDYYGKYTIRKNNYVAIDVLYDLLEDKRGDCWIATGGSGLYKWRWNEAVDANSNTIQQFSMMDGLPSTILYRIEQDEDGYLWIGTYNGLVRFDTHDNTSMVFTTKDGLSSNEFNRISSFKANNGWLYFGSMNGVNAFLPKTLNKEISALDIPFRLINLSKFSAATNLLHDCFNEFKLSHKMVLEVGDRFVSVDFALLDYQQRIHHYAYKIVGFDKVWNYLEEGSLRISGLPAGEFTLKIKAKLENGQWDKNEITIPIVVLKAVYLRWWFIVGCILMILLLFVLFFYYRTRNLNAAKLKLEIIVLERTQALENNAYELRKALGDKDLLLAEIHHRVKNNLQVISGLLELQGATIKDENIKNAFNESQSRINSIALIHENLYQHDTLESICFHAFIRDLVVSVAALFEPSKQFISFNIGEAEMMLGINKAVPLGLIVNELVTNAYKYLPTGAQTNFVSICLTKELEGEYVLQYTDNGPGLKTGINIEQPTTLGIELMKGLAEQLGGNVLYEYKEGSCFTIHFKNK